MPEKITGLLEIQDSAADPKVRVTLSGDNGSAQFIGAQPDSPATTVTSRRIAVGKKHGKGAQPSTLAGLSGDLVDTDSAPDGEPAVDTGREPQAVLSIGDEGLAGGIFILDHNGKQAFKLNGFTAALTIGGDGNAGNVFVLDATGALRVQLDGTAGEVLLLDPTGEVRVRLDGTSGDIELAGADCAEEFDVEDHPADVEPGTVMAIGDGGRLRPSRSAYDKRVAGIISGAGSYRPGIVLHKVRAPRGQAPLALSGKAYCKVDATYAPIEIGDLLTTSPTPGYAMKAVDPLQAFGTVIGKALQPLPSGQGLIPVLVALQ